MAGSFVDEQLTCVDCEQEFTFSADEQQRHAELGFQNKPKRCHPCRAEKKRRMGTDRGGSNSSGPREYHTATCAECGQQAKVPFKPRGDRPVYCSACFRPQR